MASMDLSITDTPVRVKFPTIEYRHRIWRFHAIGDGSCMIHAVLLGFSSIYRDHPRHRREYARDMRYKLGEYLRGKDEYGVRVYDRLADGNLASLGAQGGDAVKYTLEWMVAHLNSGADLEFHMLELIGWYTKRNILILSTNTCDVYKTGLIKDTYHPEWSSIVLLYTASGDSGHFDLIGVTHNSMIVTHFKHTHAFIQAILARHRALEP